MDRTERLAPLMDRLNALLGSVNNDAQEVRRRVRIIALANRPVRPGHFQTVGSALLQRKRLGITYSARGSGQTTEREVSPLRLVHYRENWYLDAWCHLRRGLRKFALDAISQAHLLERPAKEVWIETSMTERAQRGNPWLRLIDDGSPRPAASR